MARPRTELHSILTNILSSVDPSYEGNCYFRAPSKGMKYPCIKYNLNRGNPQYADDIKYVDKRRYTLTVIDYDPDSIINEEISKLRFASLDRSYDVQGLNHFVYDINF